MVLKMISSVLVIGAVFMGFKQGFAMLTGKPEMIDLFGGWGLTKSFVSVFGAITLLSALLIIFPKTFLWGNFLMAASILLIVCLHLQHRDMKGVAIELPFFLLNLVIIYLQHPLAK